MKHQESDCESSHTARSIVSELHHLYCPITAELRQANVNNIEWKSQTVFIKFENKWIPH